MAFLTLAQKLKDLFFKSSSKKPTTGCIENLSNAPTDDTVQGVFENVAGYKECMCSFLGENGAITSQIHYRNEIDATDPLFEYVSEGVYTLTFPDDTVLTGSLTTVFTTLDTTTHVIGAAVTDTEVITFNSGTITNGAAGDIIGSVFVQVRVYDA